MNHWGLSLLILKINAYYKVTIVYTYVNQSNGSLNKFSYSMFMLHMNIA